MKAVIGKELPTNVFILMFFSFLFKNEAKKN